MSDNTDYGALLRDALTASIKTDNLGPLLVDALIVVTLGACTLGIAFPALMRGYTAMCLRIARGEKAEIGESMKGFEHFGASLVIVLGLLLHSRRRRGEQLRQARAELARSRTAGTGDVHRADDRER